MEQHQTENNPRQVSLMTAILMAGGGLLAGIVICLCAGTFALVLTSSARGLNPALPIIPTPFANSGGGTIEVGQAVNGAIWDTYITQEWTFEGQADQRVTIEVRGDATADPWVWLIGPDGQVLGDNDDSFGGLDSYLNLVLPEDGTYTIRIEMLSGGGYTLSLD